MALGKPARHDYVTPLLPELLPLLLDELSPPLLEVLDTPDELPLPLLEPLRWSRRGRPALRRRRWESQWRCC